jgi:hypothetical protein
MNYFAITFAVNARSLCHFGLGLAFVQHQKDRARAEPLERLTQCWENLSAF